MIIDRIFLGHANDLYMSALGNVSSPVWTTMSFCNSLVMGASILISQSVGARKKDGIGEYAGAMMKYNNIRLCDLYKKFMQYIYCYYIILSVVSLSEVSM